MRNDFAAFILTHGRANNVKTFSALRKCGYTGRIVIVVDNEDSSVEEYKSLYGDQVFIFDKPKTAETTDSGDNFGKRNCILFARNESFSIAKKLGIKYFWQLDDDYSDFGYATDNNGEYITGPERVATKLDEILNACIDFMEESGAYSVCFAQGGDFIGGENGTAVKYIREGKFMRKVMNSFICSVDRPFEFFGRLNEDVNVYSCDGRRGKLFITVPRLRLWQTETQSSSGGMTDIYLDGGTYVKSFYTVMYSPSCAEIVEMGTAHKRIHHRIKWRYTVPKILSEDVRKPRAAPSP